MPGPVSGIDVALEPGTQWERMTSLYAAVADAVAADGRGGQAPTVVSGDCLTALGTLAGMQRGGVDASVVWLDAHGDVHTLASSTSGYLGGTALRMALGGDPDKLAGPLRLRPLPEERAALVGARDVDPAEEDYLASSGVRRLTVDELTADALPAGPLLVHVDVDVIDPADVPGLSFPVDGGPRMPDVVQALRAVFATGRVAAYDIACPWTPDVSPRQASTRAGVLGHLLGVADGPPTA
nr:arginase family protein [Motilibacter deserti]